MATLGDILTAAQNIVKAINGATDAYLSVNGKSSYENISAPALISTTSGRVSFTSVTTAGSTSGVIYDSNTLTNTTRPIAVIGNTVGVNMVNIPVDYGILIHPGTGMVLTVSYS